MHHLYIWKKKDVCHKHVTKKSICEKVKKKLVSKLNSNKAKNKQ